MAPLIFIWILTLTWLFSPSHLVAIAGCVHGAIEILLADPWLWDLRSAWGASRWFRLDVVDAVFAHGFAQLGRCIHLRGHTPPTTASVNIANHALCSLQLVGIARLLSLTYPKQLLGFHACCTRENTLLQLTYRSADMCGFHCQPSKPVCPNHGPLYQESIVSKTFHGFDTNRYLSLAMFFSGSYVFFFSGEMRVGEGSVGGESLRDPSSSSTA